MADPQVLIVGAGPTGMTAAIELNRMGIDVRILDRSDHMARHSQALMAQARDMLGPLLSVLDPVQHRAAGCISETAIEYRDSSVVHDYGGDGHLRAGDHVPELRLTHGGQGKLAGKMDDTTASGVRVEPGSG